jgi:hypothetical protein
MSKTPDEMADATPKRKHVATSSSPRLRPRANPLTRARAREDGKPKNAPPSWREDGVIRKRLAVLERLSLMGYTDESLFQQLNSSLFELGLKPISRDTLAEDCRRMVTLFQEQQPIMAAEMVASVKQHKKEGWRILMSKTEPALMRSSALRETREDDLLLAKLSGNLVDKPQVQVNVLAQQAVQIRPEADTPALRAALALMHMDGGN